jgi:hypothetical protein
MARNCRPSSLELAMGLAMAHLLTDYVDAFLEEAEIEK